MLSLIGRTAIRKLHLNRNKSGAIFIPNDDRTGPELPMLFGLNMLMAGPDSDVFTMREYREWLKATGFRGVKTIRSPNQPSPMILATK